MRPFALALAFFAFPAFAADLSPLQLGPERARVERGNLVYVALDAGGVAVVDVQDASAPKLVARVAPGRIVSRMLIAGDALVLFEAHEEATWWSLADPRAPSLSTAVAAPAAAAAPSVAPPAPSAPPARPTHEAKVVDVRGGRVIFDAGAADGFAAGQNVRIAAQKLERKPDLVTGGTVEAPSGEITAVVRIEEAQGSRSMARLGRGDVAEVGDLAMPTDAAVSERLFVPRRSPFNYLAGFHVRPFLGLDATANGGQTSKPVGFLIDAYGTWYVEDLPLAVNAQVAPAGFGLGALEAHYPVTFAATVAYATDYFEIGLGAGALVGNLGPCQTPPGGAQSCEVNTGFTFNQTLRLGALDGVNVVWHSSIFSRPDRFVFGVGRGELNVPLTRALGLFGAGGAGENGWAFGEFGVRTYVGGVGARGTVILSASLGYASIFDGPSHETVGGPSVAFGSEWRL